MKIRGDVTGPESGSQNRALDLVERWPELASRQLRLAIQETHAEALWGPYRGGSEPRRFFREHLIGSVVFDARRSVSHLHAKLRKA